MLFYFSNIFPLAFITTHPYGIRLNLDKITCGLLIIIFVMLDGRLVTSSDTSIISNSSNPFGRLFNVRMLVVMHNFVIDDGNIRFGMNLASVRTFMKFDGIDVLCCNLEICKSRVCRLVGNIISFRAVRHSCEWIVIFFRNFGKIEPVSDLPVHMSISSNASGNLTLVREFLKWMPRMSILRLDGIVTSASEQSSCICSVLREFGIIRLEIFVIPTLTVISSKFMNGVRSLNDSFIIEKDIRLIVVTNLYF